MDTDMWKWEYVHYIYPKLKTRESKETLQRMFHETDFESHDAQLFRAGWEHAGVVAAQEIRTLFRELGLPEG